MEMVWIICPILAGIGGFGYARGERGKTAVTVSGRSFDSAHNLWLIEDNCDALGVTYNGRLTGTFGHLA